MRDAGTSGTTTFSGTGCGSSSDEAGGQPSSDRPDIRGRLWLIPGFHRGAGRSAPGAGALAVGRSQTFHLVGRLTRRLLGPGQSVSRRLTTVLGLLLFPVGARKLLARVL